MNRPVQPSPLRLLLATVAVGGLLLLSPSQSAFLDLTRPLLLALFHFTGIPAADTGVALVVGQLTVPWTRDCSGINLLVILFALTVWINRTQPADLRSWFRLAIIFPAALAANTLRVLTLLAYRHIAYPAVESPQLHYFIGFIWLVPMILLVAPKDGRSGLSRTVETLHAAAVLAWLSPLINSPGGPWLAAAALFLLSQSRLATTRHPLRLLLFVLWLFAGLAIGLFSIESLWLVWLLLCPLLVPLHLLRRPNYWLTLAAAHPILILLPVGEGLAALGIASMLWHSFHRQPLNTVPSSPPPTIAPAWSTALALTAFALTLPFTASSLFASNHLPLLPPAHLIINDIGAHGYELRLPNQVSPIRLVWYAAQNNDRHHTMSVCLKYRGRDLQPVPDHASVQTDGRYWLREFFVLNHSLLPSYNEYVLRTLAPRAHPGAHLIFVAPMDALSPDDFARQTHALATQLPDLCPPSIP